jgi:hypothetical protein
MTIVLSAGAIFAQTNGFTYQGRLTDGGSRQRQLRSAIRLL